MNVGEEKRSTRRDSRAHTRSHPSRTHTHTQARVSTHTAYTGAQSKRHYKTGKVKFGWGEGGGLFSSSAHFLPYCPLKLIILKCCSVGPLDALLLSRRARRALFTPTWTSRTWKLHFVPLKSMAAGLRWGPVSERGDDTPSVEPFSQHTHTHISRNERKLLFTLSTML